MRTHLKHFLADDSGQAAISLLLILGIFLLGALGFAIDLTNIWFHRQNAIAAADAACLAGAMDMLAVTQGTTPPAKGFTIGTASDCSTTPAASMCFYAAQNGYTATGLSTTTASSLLAWTFPTAVANVTTPSTALTTTPFLKITLAENIRTFFISLLTGARYQTLNVASTCGTMPLASSSSSTLPVRILDRTGNASLYLAEGADLTLFGGPQRAVQVDSTSNTAVSFDSGSALNLATAGPKRTGADLAVNSAQLSPGSSYFNPGTTGAWHASTPAGTDPFASVPVPASIASLTPANTVNGKAVAYGVDGCPDPGAKKRVACIEFSPGYYPNGITLASNSSGNPENNGNNNGNFTAIFLPGVYYLNGGISDDGTIPFRNAKPSNWQRTDGVMFYNLSGTISLIGMSITALDTVPSTDLTCDGSLPDASLNIPAHITTSVLVAQCTKNGTYWDTGNDTTDARGTTGQRGLLIFQAHANTNYAYLCMDYTTIAGSIYVHNTTYNAIFYASCYSTTCPMLGNIVADDLTIFGSGNFTLSLTGTAATTPLRAVMLQ